MTTAEAWQIYGSAAAVMSALVASLALIFLGRQIRAANKTADLQSLVEFNRGVDDREHAFFATLRAQPPDEAVIDEAFNSLLNVLEL